MNVSGFEHPVIMKIDLNGQLLWSTFNNVRNGISGQNTCRGFDIWLSEDGFIYGVSSTLISTTNSRKIWKVNAVNGDIAFITNFYQNGSYLKLYDYDATKLVATYKRSVSGTENMAMLAYISKQTGDTIRKYEMGTCNGECGARIDKNKNLYYWRDNNFSKYNRDSLNQLLWTKTYAVVNSNPLDEIHDVYIDYQDNVFLFGRNGATFGHGDGIVAKVSNGDGSQIWNKVVWTTDIKKSDFIDRNGKLYVSYRHTLVGSVISNFTVGKLDKITGNLDWVSNQLVTAVGSSNGNGGDETAILSMDIDCTGDLYTTGYYNDANYGPAVWGNMKLNGATGVKIYDKTIDITPATQDLYSQGLSSFIYNNQSIILGQIQNMSSPNFFLSDAYFTTYNAAGDYTVLKRIGSEYSIPSKTLDIQASGDTLFYFKQQGKFLYLQSYLHRSTQIWNNNYSSATGKISLGGLMKITPNRVAMVYKENPTNTVYPFNQAVSNTIKLLIVNRNTGVTTNTITYTFTNDTITLLEMEADDNSAFVSYEKDGNVYMLRWSGGATFAAPVLMDLAGSPQSFKGEQNCVINRSTTHLIAVDNLKIKQIAKTNLTATNLFTFATPREYYDCDIHNNKLYMVGKDQFNHQLFSVYDLTTNALLADESFQPGALFQIDRDSYGNPIISGESSGNIVTKYINAMYNTVVWEKNYSLGTTDNKILYSSNTNPHSNIINQTGAISRSDGSTDFFISTINFYGDSLFTYIAGDSVQLKSFGFVAGYAPDSSSLIGGAHNRHISTREGVIFDLDTNFCNRIISGAQVTCSTPISTLSASSAISYQWTRNGQPMSGETNQTLNVSLPGRYNCIFTDACGQDTSVISFYSDTISQPQTPVISSLDSVICPNGNTLLNVSPAFHYQWLLNGNLISNSNNDSLSVNQPGSYSVVVMNTLGCTSSSTVSATIDEFAGINNSISSNTLVICPNLSGLLISNTQNSYQWYHNGQAISGATNDSLVFNNFGIYNLMIVDTNGCSDSLTNGVSIQSYPSTTTISGTSHQICHEQGQYLVCSPSQSYQWYRNGLLLSGQINDSILVNQEGNYNVVVLGNNGCTDSSQTAFTISFSPFDYDISGNSQWLCDGETKILNASSGQNNYQWFLNGVQLAQTQNSISVNQEGVYNVQITDANGCVDTLDTGYIVSVAPSTTNSIYAIEDTICNGNSSLLITTSGNSYQWLRNGAVISGESNDTLEVTLEGTYSLIVTNNYGCNSGVINPIEIFKYPSSVTINGNTTICSGTSTILTSSPALNYQWFLNGNVLTGETNQTLEVSENGNYSIVVTNTNTCIDTITNEFELNYITSNSTITSASNQICHEQSQYLISSLSQSYQWYQDGQLLSGETNDSLLINSGGEYNVLTLDYNGCLDSNATGFNVTVLPFDYTIFGFDQWLCSGPNEILIATPGQIGYEWFLNGTSLQETHNAISIGQEGIYNVQITDINGCVDTLDVGYLVSIPSPTTSSMYTTEDTICQGSNTLIIASSGSSYTWIYNGNFLQGESNDTLEASLQGTYSVLITNSFGCNSEPPEPVQVMFHPSTLNINGNATICNGTTTILTSAPAVNYQWFYETNELSGETNQTIEVSEEGFYSLVITDNNNCVDSSEIGFEVSYFEPINVNFTNSPYAFCVNDGIESILVSPTGGDLNGIGVINSNFNPNLSGAGEFTIVYSGEDSNNCTYSDSALVVVNDTQTDTMEVDTIGEYTLNGTTYTASGTYIQSYLNSVGCDSTIVLILSIDDAAVVESDGSLIQLYPNPTVSGIFFIEGYSIDLSGQVIKIIDSRGRLVKVITSNGSKTTLDLSEYERGVYFVEVGNKHFSVIYQ